MKRVWFYSFFLIFCSAAAAAPKRTIDQGNIPLWDEYVPTQNKIDYEDVVYAGEMAPGEWSYWKADDSAHGGFKKLTHDEFWRRDIDKDSFESISDRERLDNRGMILSDTRSCPLDDTMACKGWLATPHAVEFLPAGRGYVPAVREKTAEELEIERLLESKKRPPKEYTASAGDDPWADNAEFQGCPFETWDECKIWRAKPQVIETVSGKNPGISDILIGSMVAVANAGGEITADMADAAPLIRRYGILLRSARACCAGGLEYSLKSAGAGRALIYKFMVDDANFYQFGERCLMMTDEELDERYADTKTAEVVADVRNGCLCRQRQFFETLLAPFAKLAEASPKFANSEFLLRYSDGLGRVITVSVNRDVSAVLGQLGNCP